MSVNVSNLMQNVYDYLLGRYSQGGAAGATDTFLAFERLGQNISPSEFKLKPQDASFSPQLAEERVFLIVNSMMAIAPDFCDTTMNLDDFYSMLLAGSTPQFRNEESFRFFANLKAQAKKDFDQALRASMVVDGGTFYKTTAMPNDWFDDSVQANWSPVSFSSESPALKQVNAAAMKVSAKLGVWRLSPDQDAVSQVVDTDRFATKLKPMMVAEVATSPGGVRSPVAGTVLSAAAVAPKRTAGSQLMHTVPMLSMRPAKISIAPAIRPTVDVSEIKTFARRNFLAGAPLDFKQRVLLQRAVSQVAPTQPVAADKVSIQFEYCVVKVDRRWMYEPFLRDRSWYIPEYMPGEFSSGTLNDNKGMFPAYPVAFIAVKKLDISARWATGDRAALGSAIGLGPFSLADGTVESTSLRKDGIQIIAWICKVLPKLPPAGDPNR